MRKGQFEKGNKGGPGRPKGSGNIEWCREFAEGEGKKLLLQWARSGQGKTSMQALTLIFAYGHGKPKEHHDLNVGFDGELFERLERCRSNADKRTSK